MVTDVLVSAEKKTAVRKDMGAIPVITEKERDIIQKNMDLAVEHTHYILEHLDELENIPDGATLIFDNDRVAGEKLRAKGEKVVYVNKVYEYS
jgi:hypothetical protein